MWKYNYKTYKTLLNSIIYVQKHYISLQTWKMFGKHMISKPISQTENIGLIINDIQKWAKFSTVMLGFEPNIEKTNKRQNHYWIILEISLIIEKLNKYPKNETNVCLFVSIFDYLMAQTHKTCSILYKKCHQVIRCYDNGINLNC